MTWMSTSSITTLLHEPQSTQIGKIHSSYLTS